MNGWGGGGEGQKQQPFQDMTALIHTKKERVKSFTRLIKAGGGQVVSARWVLGVPFHVCAGGVLLAGEGGALAIVCSHTRDALLV